MCEGSFTRLFFLSGLQTGLENFIKYNNPTEDSCHFDINSMLDSTCRKSSKFKYYKQLDNSSSYRIKLLTLACVGGLYQYTCPFSTMNGIIDSQEIHINCRHQSMHQCCNVLTVTYVQMICSIPTFHGHHFTEHNLSWTSHWHMLNMMLKKILDTFFFSPVCCTVCSKCVKDRR